MGPRVAPGDEGELGVDAEHRRQRHVERHGGLDRARSGGAGILKRSRLEQLVRDARLGRIHPGNPMFTHEVVGKLSLGINPDEQPRWG